MGNEIHLLKISGDENQLISATDTNALYIMWLDAPASW